MAILSQKQKKDIRDLKLLISQELFTVAKIQDASSVEQNLLQEAMNYISLDRIGDYEGRMAELNKLHYMIRGILYSHLDSKQLNFGAPASLNIFLPAPMDIVPPAPIEMFDQEEEPF